ncbi:hypothetical protein [Glutamicibacter ardleyensis]|uniref:hypothetical protein n=1 Tax=Glutamicibacter ardleyensis TaxID=225894 RepID=UPI003FD05614
MKVQQKRSAFTRYNPHPTPDEDGLIEPDVQVASDEEHQRLESICREIEQMRGQRTWAQRDDYPDHGLGKAEIETLAEKHWLHPHAIEDLARNTSTQRTTSSSDAVARYLKTGKARATYAKLAEAGADFTFVPVEHDHDPGIVHFGYRFNREFNAQIDNQGRMQFGYAGRPDETFRDANAFDPNDLNKAYYETIDRGIAAELSKRHGIEAQFNKTSGRLDAVRIADNAKFSYDVETTDSNSSTGHPVPEGTLRDLASKAYYHPMTVARNVRDCPIQGGLPNPYVRKKE